jgi:type IX secretion system PorP/SprF family membrane protein
MKINFKIIVLVVMAFSFSGKAQQQSLYTNYLLNSYAYNPAVAGAQPYLQANMSYRNQWVGFDGAPKTALVSLYGPLKKQKNIALGGMIVSDKTGLITTNSGYLTFAYHVKLNKKTKLGFGLSGGMKQYTVRLYDVKAYDKGDDYLTGSTLNANVFDANAGIYLHGERFFMGLSSMNMLNNKIPWKNPTGTLVPHWYGVIGYNIKLSKDLAFQPSILCKYNNRDLFGKYKVSLPVQLEYSGKLSYKNMIWIGGNYRTDDAVSFLAGITVIKKLNIAYSYDYSLSTIKKYNQGGHEICLNYNFIKKKVVNVDEEEFKIKDNSIKQSLKNKKPGTEQKPEEGNPNKQENKTPDTNSEPKKPD